MDELRLEPVPSGGINDTLAARIHDPLWFLARQWQIGEFLGDDSGSPRLLEVQGESHPIVSYALGDGPWRSVDPNVPLDVTAERAPEPDLRFTIEAGAHFLRLLQAEGLAQYRAAVIQAFAVASVGPFLQDPLMAVSAAGVPDPEKLATDLEAFIAGRPALFRVDAGDRDTAVGAATRWLNWYAEERGPVGPDDAWDPHRFEHRLRIASTAAGGVVLRAGDYTGEGLDWCEFDIVEDATLPELPAPAPTALDVRATPTPVTFGGMPAPRYWEFEDARFDFGNVDAAGHDLGRLLLVQFAMVFGNDWFLVPVPLEVGTVSTIATVTLTDVFGRRFRMTRAGKDEPQWNLFSHATASGASHPAQGAMLVPPVIGTELTSEATEVVHLMRDEVANLSWAIERYVDTGFGKRLDRHAAWRVGRRNLPPAAPGRPQYVVETEVPDYWIPMQPREFGAPGSVQLVVSPLLVASENGFAAAKPRGSLLHSPDGKPLWVFEEEVPRAGISLERVTKYGRWHNGRAFVWRARRKRAGRGEGSSGLRFDVLLPE